MTGDKIWLISAIVCFVAAIAALAGTAIGLSDTLVRIIGAVNIVSLVIVVYRTMNRKGIDVAGCFFRFLLLTVERCRGFMV